jgi:hypothetical protein
MVGLFESALQLSGKRPRVPCYIRLPIELPEVCERRLTSDVTVIGGTVSGQLLPVSGGPERIWFAQTGPIAEAALPADPALATATRVFVQFTGNIERTDSTGLSLGLAALGWQVEGADQGGELVPKGPDRNEVRFFHDADQAAAVALAQSLFALNPDILVAVRDFTRLGTYAPDGQLEVWLDQVTSVTPGT